MGVYQTRVGPALFADGLNAKEVADAISKWEKMPAEERAKYAAPPADIPLGGGEPSIRARTWKDTAAETIRAVVPPLGQGLGEAGGLAAGKTPSSMTAGGGVGQAAGQYLADEAGRVLQPDAYPPRGGLLESTKDTARQVAEGAGASWLGAKVGGSVSAHLESMGKKELTPVAAEGLEASTRVPGYTPTPSQRMSTPFVARWETFAKRTLGGGELLDQDMRNLEALVAQRDRLLEMGDTSGTIGVLGQKVKKIVDGIEAREGEKAQRLVSSLRSRIDPFLDSKRPLSQVMPEVFEAGVAKNREIVGKAGGAFNAVGDVLPEGYTFPTKNLSDTAMALREAELKKANPATRDEALLRFVDTLFSKGNKGPEIFGPGGEVVGGGKAAMTPVDYDWYSANAIMQKLFELGSTGKSPAALGAAAKGEISMNVAAMKRLREALSQDMETAALASGKQDAYQAWQVAKAMWRDEVKGVYGTNYAKSIFGMEKGGDLSGAAAVIMRDPQSVARARQIFGDDAVKKVSDSWLNARLTEAYDPVSGRFNPKAIESLLVTHAGKEGVLQKVYGEQMVTALTNLKSGMNAAQNLRKMPNMLLVRILDTSAADDVLGQRVLAKSPSEMSALLAEAKAAGEVGERAIKFLRGQWLKSVLGESGGESAAAGLETLRKSKVGALGQGATPVGIKLDAQAALLFSPQERAALTDLAKVVRMNREAVQRGYSPGSGEAAMIGYMQQGGGLGLIGAGKMFLSNKVVSKILNSEGMKNLAKRLNPEDYANLMRVVMGPEHVRRSVAMGTSAIGAGYENMRRESKNLKDYTAFGGLLSE